MNDVCGALRSYASALFACAEDVLSASSDLLRGSGGGDLARTRVGGKEYVATKRIAEGAFSYVYLAHCVGSSKQYAMKRVIVQTKEQIESVRREIRTHEAFDHPNLLPLVGHTLDAIDVGTKVAYLIFPLYAEGSLEDALNRGRLRRDSQRGGGVFFEESAAVSTLHQIALGVRAFHKHAPDAWAHRDIKPGNVLVDSDGTCVLMDFGSVSKARQRPSSRAEALQLQEWAAENCSMPYRAPELFDVKSGDDGGVTEQTDIWSLGCTLYALVFGYSPFECSIDAETGMARVEKCSFLRVINGPKFPPKNGGMSDRLCELISEMLDPNPEKRPDIDALCERTRRWRT